MIAVMVQLATAHTLLRILCECLESLLEFQIFALSAANWPHQPEVLRQMARQLVVLNDHVNQLYPTLNEAEALLDRSLTVITTRGPDRVNFDPALRDNCGRVLAPLNPNRFNSQLPRQRSRSRDIGR